MFAASALAIFLIPVTFFVIEMWATKGQPHSAHKGANTPGPAQGTPPAAH
jgi:hypothetical protein